MVVVTVAIGAKGSAEGAPTPKVNGDAAGEKLLANEKPALASAVDDENDDDDEDEDDGNDCDADDALAGPGPSQAAHLLSWLGLRTLHVPHFHDSAGSPLELGGTAHDVVDHIPPFGTELTTATLSALPAADSTSESEEESGACSQRTNQSAKSATHKWSALSALDAAMRRSSDPCDSALYVAPNRVINRQITPQSSSCTAAATDMSTVSAPSPPTTARHASTACWSSVAMSFSSSASSSSSLTYSDGLFNNAAESNFSGSLDGPGTSGDCEELELELEAPPKTKPPLLLLLLLLLG